MSALKVAATCLDCPATLSAKNKSGRCSPCGNRRRESDPAFRARRVAGIRKSFDNPARRATAATTMRRAGRIALERPEHRAWMVERGKQLYRDVLTRPDVVAKTKAAVSKARKLRAERELAWCPLEYRELLDTLKRSKKLPAAEARRAVEAEIVSDKRRAKRPRTFEEQLALVANGASLANKVALRRADHDFTLGGVSAGMGL